MCSDCVSDPSRTSHALLSRDHLAQSRLAAIHQICASCSSTPVHEPILCDSIDCPITYARIQATRDAEDLKGVQEVLDSVINDPGPEEGGAVQVTDGEEKEPFWQAMEW